MDLQQSALLDITVLMDAIVNEQEPDNASKILLDLATAGRIKGHVCATAVQLLSEALTRDRGPAQAHASLQRICATLVITPIDAAVIDGAMSLGWRCLDDALTFESARQMGVANVVTLNGPDFDSPALNVQEPADFLRTIQRSN